jgi:hypothetical protein
MNCMSVRPLRIAVRPDPSTSSGLKAVEGLHRISVRAELVEGLHRIAVRPELVEGLVRAGGFDKLSPNGGGWFSPNGGGWFSANAGVRE